MNKYNILACMALIFVSSCSSVAPGRDLTGVYKVTKRNCVGSQFQLNACAQVQLLEIVKGRFYKIKDHENAFVVWSGKHDLNYNARKLGVDIEADTFPFELQVEKNEAYSEKLVFMTSDEGRYVYGKANSLSTLLFERATQEDLEKYSKEYPGND